MNYSGGFLIIKVRLLFLEEVHRGKVPFQDTSGVCAINMSY